MIRFISNSETDTINSGKELVRFLDKGDIVCLYGDLGAGKTVFAKGMAKGLGINSHKVISPSFVLMRQYLSRPGSIKNTKGISLYHFDFYRLKSPRDIFDLGYEEYLYGSGISVIEWAERMDGFLPAEFLRVELTIKDDTKRLIKLSASGTRYSKLLSSFQAS